MQYTENYSLRKPQAAETASYQDLNYNSDKIDGIMADNRQISLSMYVSGNTYNTGDLVGYENPSTHHIRVYRCLVDNVTGTWDSTKWTLTNLADEILDAKASGGTEVEANPTGTPSDTLNTVEIDSVIYAVGGDSANQNIADDFSELQTYAVGDYCIYESILYKCTTAVQTAGAWDSTKWTSCVVTDEMGSGGGGGSSTLAGLDDVGITTPTDGQILVYDDTNDEWVNGNIAGVNVQPVVYSTEEREVGVFTDGKPLYEKTYQISSISSLNADLIDISDLGIDKVVNLFGQLIGTQMILNIPLSDSSNNQCVIFITSSNWKIRGRASFGNGTFVAGYITIQYTKTADVAGSGTWTPQGIPTHHYSTEEQVVGTWIDGDTIYEKTYESSSRLSLTANTWIGTGISSAGVKSVIDALLFGNDSNFLVSSTTLNGVFTINSPRTLELNNGYALVVRYTKTSS